MRNITDYYFELPDELIANKALAERSSSRLMFIDRNLNDYSHHNFNDISNFLQKGDTLVLNNTKVFPARLLGTTDTGGKAEIFLIKQTKGNIWQVLAKPAKRLKNGKTIRFDEELSATVIDQLGEGKLLVEFDAEGDVFEHFERVGRTPLPPYIKRERDENDLDRDRYQTVYASERGAIAAPTAGLHFTPDMLDNLQDQGINLVKLTLHVGYGTFEPVKVVDLTQHKVMAERYTLDEVSAERLNKAKADNKRIIAVGTTTTRALETNISKHGKFSAESGEADITIIPGYQLKAINGLLTNFHLPQSSLLVLVSVFGGYRLIMDAYKAAVAERYRFYSYGDCMLII